MAENVLQLNKNKSEIVFIIYLDPLILETIT